MPHATAKTQPLWTPSPERITNSQLSKFQSFVEDNLKKSFNDYAQLHDWSISHSGEFWDQLWQYCGVLESQTYSTPLINGEKFPGAEWFPKSRLNFAENLLKYNDDKIALVGLLDTGGRKTYTYAQLHSETAQLASALRKQGVQVGDRVAGLMPNVCETVVAMLATTSIGAIWSSCSPDFGFNGIFDRFQQIEPKILICSEAYSYNNKRIDCLPRVAEIQKSIASIEKTVVVGVLDENRSVDHLENTTRYREFLDPTPEALVFEQLPFAHPVYINYSSGTTGVPKCIVHGGGGTLLQHLKEHQLHCDIGRDDVLFYFTTCGWMMWNWLVSGLASGCTLILFDGSPFAQDGRVLLDAIDNEKISIFGTSAKYLSALEKHGHKPIESHDLSSLKSILSTGSPLSSNSYDYIYSNIKQDICVSSICGGTDIISCFILGNPCLPVYRGEIQCKGLGMAVEIWSDDGKPLIEEKGELVCTKPFPSTPIGFWNDTKDEKFLDAYFSSHPNIWSHGDYGEITKHDGVVIHGRSDAVLNPGGVRIGTAEIYRQVEKIEQVIDCIAVGQEFDDDVRVILFVVLQDDSNLDEELADNIKRTIRANTTPRHVPAKIIAVLDIPRTISGKIVELAVKNIIHGRAVKNTSALANPEALAYFENLAELQS